MGNKRIVLTTIGSLGDLHPYIALALELKARGYEAVIATNELYHSNVQAVGISFHPISPDTSSLSPDQAREIVRLSMDRVQGTKYVICELVLPSLKDSYEDLMQAVQGADLLITHPIIFAGPIVAQKTGIPWISTVLSPISFMSAFDPPVLQTLPVSRNLGAFNSLINKILFRFAKLAVRSWTKPIQQLRVDLGLPPGKDPLFEGQHSPDLVLALFSQFFASPQPDWPKQTHITGFPFYDDRSSSSGLSLELSQFLDTGSPPIVFTLGSTEVMDAGSFYLESAIAAKELGCRAVLLTGEQPSNIPQNLLSKNIVAFDYAPYSMLFPRASAVVHQGGIGTTAQALESGCPMLVTPYSYDQPDNAARAERLGVARTITRSDYNAYSAAGELKQLLNNLSYTKRATDVGKQIRAENGVRAACDAIEARLNVPSRTRHN